MVTQSTAEPATPAEPKVKVMNDCLCSCGGKTARRFMPGHDARLKGELLRTATDQTAKAGDRTKAEKRLNELGWGHFLTKAQATADRKAKAKADREQAAQERKDAAEKAKAERTEAKAKEKEAKAKAKADAAAEKAAAGSES